MKRLALILVLAPACDSSLTACDKQADVTGHWVVAATPLGTDAGPAALPMAFSIDAQLVQGQKTDPFAIGHYIHGTLTASDPSVFGSIAIPELAKNDGGKTGAIRGCTLVINVPIATPVTDDATDQGPLRISLNGSITAKGHMESGTVPSTVALVSDSSDEERPFAWTADQN